MRGLVALSLLAASCGARHHSLQVGEAEIALVGVTVVPMDRERELPDQTVIVRGGRIVAAGPRAGVPVSSGATRIDGRGKYLIPGLADMHVHLYDPPSLAVYLANGVTTIRVMAGTPLAVGLRDAVAAGFLEGPTIVTAGPIVDGKPGVWPGSTEVTTAEEAAAAVRAQKQAGYDFVKVYSRLSREAYDGAAAAAREARMPFAGHVPRDVGLARVLEAGQASVEHMDGFMMLLQRPGSPYLDPRTAPGNPGRLLENVDEAKIPEVVARTLASGVWLCPTLLVHDRSSRLDHPEEFLAEPENVYVAPIVRASWDPRADFRFKKLPEGAFAWFRRNAAFERRLVKLLADAGAPLLAGTDDGNAFIVPGFSLLRELVMLQELGLSPYRVLEAATSAPARFLGVADRAGTIAPGQRADLVLLDADPLADVRNLARRAGVMVRGFWHPEAELQARLAEVAAVHRGERSRLSGPGARYLIERQGLVAGEGSLGEAVIEQVDDGNPPFSWRIDGDARRFTAIDVDIRIQREGDELVFHGTTGQVAREGRAPATPDVILEGPTFAPDPALVRRLLALAPGASLEVTLMRFRADPELGFDRLAVRYQRSGDTFTVSGDRQGTLELDAAGRPVRIVLDGATVTRVTAGTPPRRK